MATASRQIDPTLERSALQEALEEEPFRFQFFQAVRLLERLAPERHSVGRFFHPSSEVVRFTARPSLSFPASEVHSIDFPENKPPRMMVNFMGLTGPQGVLPLCYTELILSRLQNRDTALSEFFDIFNHRIISLFYQAWEKYHFTVAYERDGQDQISRHLLDLVGLGTTGLQKRLEPEIRDDALLYYSGLLAQRPASAVGLEQLLSDYFEVPVEIEQFCGIWRKLDRASQTCLEEGNRLYETLGLGAVVGDEVWDQQSIVRLRIGPLSLELYLEFLPTGAAHKPLQSLVRLYSVDEKDFEVLLMLKRDETPSAELGGLGMTAPQLGWVTWMKSVPIGRDPADVIISL